MPTEAETRELERIRVELDVLARRRLSGLTAYERERYEALTAREREILARDGR